MNGETLTVLKEVAASLGEIAAWTRVTAFPTVKKIIVAEFGAEDEDAKIRAQIYALTDGARWARDISEAIGGVRKDTAIKNMHARWRKMGLALATNPASQRSPTKAVFDLADFGVQVVLTTASAKTVNNVVPLEQSSSSAGASAFGGNGGGGADE